MCDFMSRQIGEAKKFLEDWGEYQKEYERKGAEKTTCDHGEFTRWDCCLEHRRLDAMCSRMKERGVILNYIFELGGITYGQTLCWFLNVSYDAPQNNEHYSVLSDRWFEILSEKISDPE